MHERTDYFPLDTLLRRHGWQIASRPQQGEALWRRQGETRTQSLALATLPQDEVKQARAACKGLYQARIRA